MTLQTCETRGPKGHYFQKKKKALLDIVWVPNFRSVPFFVWSGVGHKIADTQVYEGR